MTKGKRHSSAEIAAKLRQADALFKQGKLQREIAQALEVSVWTYQQWRKSIEASSVAALAAPAPFSWPRANSINELREENARLRHVITDLLLEKMKLEERLGRRLRIEA
jgi:putative transposase